MYECDKPISEAKLKLAKMKCHPDADCKEDPAYGYKCVCREGFRGDKLGLNCTKGSYKDNCTAVTQLCNDLAGLSCQDGLCKCANDSYWKETKCGLC
jgi:hypothetical protein